MLQTQSQFVRLILVALLLESSLFCEAYSRLNGLCPAMCACTGLVINCKYKQLSEVPRDLPDNVEKLHLGGNQIVRIRSNDFRRLKNLKSLYLNRNEISIIEKGAFDALVSLKRLRLSHNRIKEMPDGLFKHNFNLVRLDLNDNQLQCLGGKSLIGTSNLKYLQLSKNRISWMSPEPFYRMTHLKVLCLSGNPFNCNCHLKWLSEFLTRRSDLLAQHNQLLSKHRESRDTLICHSPLRLKHKSITSLEPYDFTCTEEQRTRIASPCARQRCSNFCSCTPDGVAICDRKKLTEIPDNLPTDIREIQLQHNNISSIPSRAFQRYPQLKKLFLNANKISRIAKDAFYGLNKVNALYLNFNEIRHLPEDIFKDLNSLQILYLHKNRISCIPKKAFKYLPNLFILHLSQNEIKSLEYGTFDGLSRLRYLYLAENPFICDCHLSWLAGYLAQREGGGYNGPFASCVSPSHLAGREVRQLKTSELSCSGQESNVTKRAGTCNSENCPPKCRCNETSIDCSKAGLTQLPDRLPTSVTSLYLQWNRITHIFRNSSLSHLKRLKILDLSSNEIYQIENGAFSGLVNLKNLDLSHNQLGVIDNAMFKEMKQLESLILRNNNITCLNNDVFNEVPQIKTVDLNHNKIRCVMKGVFNNLRQMKTLSLSNNLLNCNCRLSWLSDWLRKHNSIIDQSQPVTCSLPNLLQSTPLTALKPHFFVCRENASQPGCENRDEPCCTKDVLNCDSRAHCPQNCICEGTIIRCNQQNLTEVPSDIPADTTELYLERNSIRQLVASSFAHLNKLQTLALSYNQISELRENTFKGLSELQTLIISFNNLQCIHPKAFSGLHKLKALILLSNDLSTIPYGLFDDLTNLNNIALSQNPFYCDCNLKWLKDFFHKNFLDNGMALCSAPPQMSLKSIYHAKATHFLCNSDDTDSTAIAHKCNVCLSKQPCQNGGQCHLIGYHNYRCECRQPFHGNNCEQQITACFGKPCMNGGECRNLDNYGNYECICPSGFSGTRCTMNDDDCLQHQCKNGGVCVDQVKNYTCSCPEGFKGQFCENSFQYCTEEDPCLNGGKCLTADKSYKCECDSGWEGRNCAESVDDCRDHTCQNGAQCKDGHREYSCQCRPGYNGKYCEDLSWVAPSPIQSSSSSSCSLHRCQNGAQCQPISRRPGYICKCQRGFAGNLCEQLHSATFSIDSFAAYQAPRPMVFQPSGNITLLLSTGNREGNILYAEDGDKHLTLDLFDGHVRVVFNLGYAGSTAYSTDKINDHMLHKLVLSIRGENVTLNLDNNPSIYLRAAYRHERNFTLRMPLYIGTAPDFVMTSARKNWRVMTMKSFTGCMQAVYINAKPIDFLRLRGQSNNIRPGCAVQPVQSGQQSDSRSGVGPTLLDLASVPVKSICTRHGNLCLNGGVCVPEPRIKMGYRCRCRSHYTGYRCGVNRNNYQRAAAAAQNSNQNQYGRINNSKSYRRNASTKPTMCHREHDRAFMRDPDTQCVSKRKVKLRNCVGQCTSPYGGVRNESCCQPKRFKKKRIGFVCLDGRAYNKIVTLIRKCACSTCHA